MSKRRFDVTGLTHEDFVSALRLALTISGKKCISVLIDREEETPRLIVYDCQVENSLSVAVTPPTPCCQLVISAAGKWLREHDTLSSGQKIGWRVYLPLPTLKGPLPTDNIGKVFRDFTDEVIPHREHAICVVAPIWFDITEPFE